MAKNKREMALAYLLENMTLQHIFESYQQYWWAMFLAVPVGLFIMHLFTPLMYDDETELYRCPTTFEAIMLIWDEREFILFLWLILGIICLAGWWFAPIFTDQMI